MPLVDIQLIAGVFDQDQKRATIEKVTDTMVEIEGEAMRAVTWVRIQEIAEGMGRGRQAIVRRRCPRASQWPCLRLAEPSIGTRTLMTASPLLPRYRN
jgi:4-oxalocrotonate tautomerase